MCSQRSSGTKKRGRTTSAIAIVLWPGIRDIVGDDAVYAGILADKPGYHNSRNRLIARGLTNDYSIQLAIDKEGPGDEGAALDVTFKTAQGGDYRHIAKFSKLLYEAGERKDSRAYPLREFQGNIDTDDDVEGWSFYRSWALTSSDKSHLWHIHQSIHRKYINDAAAMESILSIWRGEQQEPKPVTVTTEQIQAAKDAGMQNVELIAECCNETGARFYIALAMLEKETGTCRNVYGHDVGGALSGFPLPVNEHNYAVFRWLIFTKGQQSNGVGPSQLTFKGFFADMEAKGLKPYDMHDNIGYGITLIQQYYRDGRNQGKTVNEALRYAGTKYNGSTTYGDSYLQVALKWKARVGSADYS